jgi:endonuclease I
MIPCVQTYMLLNVKYIILNSLNTPNIYNINKYIDSKLTQEHIYPKSFLNSKHKNNMHNLFKCNKEINNIRSNYKFTDFKFIKINKNDFTKINNTDNYVSIKHKLFVPEDESKGIIARSIMYMCYEYKYKTNKVIDSNILIDWCLNYPPTEEEINHNNIVFYKQYTRNKFIDLYKKKGYKNIICKCFL